jgi:hypothetical protein
MSNAEQDGDETASTVLVNCECSKRLRMKGRREWILRVRTFFALLNCFANANLNLTESAQGRHRDRLASSRALSSFIP